MTRDEVMMLTDEDLRIKAARHAGFDEVGIAYVPIPWLMDICEDTLAGRLGGELVAIPDYPNDIAAAWDLWDRLIDDGWYPMFRAGSMNDGTRHYSREATVLLWHAERDTIEVVEKDDRAAPLAITRAFILAMQEKP